MASELGFEYMVLEGFWRSSWNEAQLKDVVAYARERGVKAFVWYIRSAIQDPKILEQNLELCNRVGIAGLKIDFFDHEHKEVIDLYEMFAKAAARHKLMVDFHGCNKPTGMERTYPNIVGMEGVRGMEFFPPYAQHDVVLPFTRMLAGMADYTPVHFGSRLADTTWAHQVANAVILQSPLQVYSAHPANIMANPSVDVLKKIPSVWDETVVLNAEVGKSIVMARRSGERWFLAAMNGDAATSLTVPLKFLGGKKWALHGFADDPKFSDYQTVVDSTSGVNAKTVLTLSLAPGGGFAGIINQAD